MHSSPLPLFAVSRSYGREGASLTHVHRAVKAHHRAQHRQQTDHEAGPRRLPTAAVGDGQQCRSGVILRRHDQERDDDREEAKDMQDQDGDFRYREGFGQEHIHRDGDGDGCDDQKRAVPLLRLVSGIVQGDETLDDGASDERESDNGSLPSNRQKPAYMSYTSQNGSVQIFFY